MSAGLTKLEREAVIFAIDNRQRDLTTLLKESDDALRGYAINPSLRANWQLQLDALQSAREKLPRVAAASSHPHDGYAYDGCNCVCCVNVRTLS